ncbi:NUDIX domain-containing protein, partial [Actinomadura sp. DSM 109109]|nr:NUDIX domain-containing protein [Actinomadura lepetitiana]
METAREDGVEEIRASGGLVVRDGRVAVVHRPEYDDWSLPKGKADRGESDEDCALREIEEETGMRCELGVELTTTRHRDTKGRPKRVRWWLMRPLSGEFEPTHEVDDLRWLT